MASSQDRGSEQNLAQRPRHDKQGLQQESLAVSQNYGCQTGVLSPFDLDEHALYIVIHLAKGSDDVEVRKACHRLPHLREVLSLAHPECRLEATLGIGWEKTHEWLGNVKIPVPKVYEQFEAKTGPTGKAMPHTGGDILVHIRSNRKDLCFELGLQFTQEIPESSVSQLDDIFGFAFESSRSNGLSKDLTGFEDGNENPKIYEKRAKAGLIQDDDSYNGCSFALTQKWRHNLPKWDRLGQKEQEDVFGRTKGQDSKKN